MRMNIYFWFDSKTQTSVDLCSYIHSTGKIVKHHRYTTPAPLHRMHAHSRVSACEKGSHINTPCKKNLFLFFIYEPNHGQIKYESVVIVVVVIAVHTQYTMAWYGTKGM